MKIIENTYINLNNICKSCGFPVANTTNSLSHYCIIEDGRSPCLKDRDYKHVQKSRKKAETVPIKLKNNEKMRECIGIGCMDKPPKKRMFKSSGPGHRKCKICGLIKEGIPVSKMSIVPGKIIPGKSDYFFFKL